MPHATRILEQKLPAFSVIKFDGIHEEFGIAAKVPEAQAESVRELASTMTGWEFLVKKSNKPGEQLVILSDTANISKSDEIHTVRFPDEENAQQRLEDLAGAFNLPISKGSRAGR